jgi:hypothetical protein
LVGGEGFAVDADLIKGCQLAEWDRAEDALPHEAAGQQLD